MTKAKQLTPRGQAGITSFMKKRSLPQRTNSPTNQTSSPDLKKVAVTSNVVEVMSNKPSPMVISLQRDKKPRNAEPELKELTGKDKTNRSKEEEGGQMDQVKDKGGKVQNKPKAS